MAQLFLDNIQNSIIMEKSTRIVVLFCIALSTIPHVFALNSKSFPETTLVAEENCEVPPPENFRAESRGYNFIDLTWDPISAGSNHTLLVFIRTDSANAWEPFGTFNDLPGASFSVEGVGFEHYCRFVIATNCETGEPSAKHSDLEEDKIIIDLIISGRAPINPIPVDCYNISLKKHDWVGFKVEEVVSGNSVLTPTGHLFEFEIGSNGHLEIKRVLVDGEIVASNLTHKYPQFAGEIVPVTDPPLITKPLQNGGFQDIGRIGVTLHDKKASVDICVFSGPPVWNYLNYTFTALVAENTEERPQATEFYHEGLSKKLEKRTMNGVGLNSPFVETLTIFIPALSLDNNQIKIRMFNVSGQLVFEEKFSNNLGSISIETGKVDPGLYIVIVENSYGSTILKAIKFDR